jgi:hypothetical protein
MKLVSALVGLAALGGVALTSAAASATPIDVPAASTVVPAGYVCNEYGHCWHRHWGGGYPQRWGGYGWHRHWGGGYGGWHHGWHHAWHHPWGYGGGYGWRPHWGGGWGWHHWHHYW